MRNLKGIIDAEVIRDELLGRGLSAGERQLTVRGDELVAAITGTHPHLTPGGVAEQAARFSADIKPVPQSGEAASPATDSNDAVATPPAGQQTIPPTDPPRTTNPAAAGKKTKKSNTNSAAAGKTKKSRKSKRPRKRSKK